MCKSNFVLKYVANLGYTSEKKVKIENPYIAIVYWLGLLLIMTYVVVYTIIIDRGYQSTVVPVGYILTKAKGVAFNTTSTFDGFNFFDSIDLVPSGAEMDALFLATAIIQTRQSRGICKGKAKCVTGDDCISDASDNIGVYTGECFDGHCQQWRWCPPENRTITKANKLSGIEQYTYFWKVIVYFEDYDIILMNTEDKLGTGRLTPGYNLFLLSEILADCGIVIDEIETGALINVKISYNCNFDENKTCHPYPKFSWRREDKNKNSVSKGFNFRQTFYMLNNSQSTDRLLVKYYGIRIKFNVEGQGRKFDITALSKTLGSGIGLTAIATLIAEFILTYCIPARPFYTSKCKEIVSDQEEAKWLKERE